MRGLPPYGRSRPQGPPDGSCAGRLSLATFDWAKRPSGDRSSQERIVTARRVRGSSNGQRSTSQRETTSHTSPSSSARLARVTTT